jgi:ABC-type multidrug transport system fused ATPase/permease subunit
VSNIKTEKSIRVLLLALWGHLSLRRRRQYGLLAVLMIFSAIAEVVSLGAVLPFLGILVAPEKLFNQPIVAEYAKSFGWSSSDQLVLPLTVGFIGVITISGAIRMGLLWVNTRLVHASGADLSIEAYRRTLYQPYQVHVARNTSDVINGILGKIGVAVNVLTQVLTLVSSIILIGFITAALVIIDTTVALIAISSFSVCYGAITLTFRHSLFGNSKTIAERGTQVLKALQEGLGGIRDVLLNGTQPTYCRIYRDSDIPLRRAQAVNLFISSSPRFALEALGMALIAGLAYGLSFQEGGLLAAIPVLGALALGAQRMLPALQMGYSAWTTILGNRASLVDVIDLLDQPMLGDFSEPVSEPLKFAKAIEFVNVHFRYSDESPWVLEGVNLSIPKGARIAFIGSTGSGKSTAIDLLMGLLSPSNGTLLVDGEPIEGNRVKAWQRTIAHVPQSIYLADSTIAENIAFGIAQDQIDMGRVKQAAHQAHIADFIDKSAEGYDAFVGERGIRLSGGQRQRIGIARAFYKQASVLVFDEATSALDNATEESVMEAIDELSSDLTIIIIAHRMSTVRNCDTIVELDNGKTVAIGSYQQLVETSSSFKQALQSSS